jgi:hypothetical protein
VRRLEAAGLRELSQRLQVATSDVAAAQARPGDAMLAPALLQLLALRQLHEDAALLDRGYQSP